MSHIIYDSNNFYYVIDKYPYDIFNQTPFRDNQEKIKKMWGTENFFDSFFVVKKAHAKIYLHNNLELSCSYLTIESDDETKDDDNGVLYIFRTEKKKTESLYLKKEINIII